MGVVHINKLKKINLCYLYVPHKHQKIERSIKHKLLPSSLVDRSLNRLRSAIKFALLMRFNRTSDLIDANEDNYWKIKPQFVENNLNERIARRNLFLSNSMTNLYNYKFIQRLIKFQITSCRNFYQKYLFENII